MDTSSVPINLKGTPARRYAVRGMTTKLGNLTIDLNPSEPFKAYIRYYFVELDLTTNKTDRIFNLLEPGETEPSLLNVVNDTGATLKLYGVTVTDAIIKQQSFTYLLFRSVPRSRCQSP